MRIAEIFGPSGAGKTTLHDEVIRLGGVYKNPAFSVKQAWEILDVADEEHITRCAAYLAYIFRKDGPAFASNKTKSVACGVYRALAKYHLAWSHREGSKAYMLIDGGMAHLATSIERMGVDHIRYLRKMPLPDVAIKLTAPRELLLERNKNLTRSDGTDRAAEVDRSIRVSDDALNVLGIRGCPILELDALNSVEENAAHVHSILCRDNVRKFEGILAQTYDTKRTKQERFQAEQNIIEDMLSDLPEDSYVLDCPVGTGRFIPYFEEKRFIWTGVDKSDDMLKQAGEKGKQHNAAKIRANLVKGDILELPFEDDSFDAALMIRMTRWLTPEGRDRALREMQRISRNRVIFTARVRESEVSNYPYPYEDIKKSLYDNWEIHRDEAASEEDYRVIELRRK